MAIKKPKTLASKQATKAIKQVAAKKVAATQARKAAKKAAVAEPKDRSAKKAATKKSAERALTEKAGVVKPKGKKVSAVKKTKTPVVRAPRQRAGSLPEGVEFVPGSDMEHAFRTVLKGGPSRAAVAHMLVDHWKDSPTRNGGQKPVSTIINHVVRRAIRSGFHVEESWRVVPNEGVELPKSVQDYIASLNGEHTGTSTSKETALANATDPKRARKTARKMGTAKGVKKPLKKQKA